MSQLSNPASEITLMFQLKGGLYPLTALQLLGTNLDLFKVQLENKIKQAPKFFFNAPIVLDLQKIQQPDIIIDFKKLYDILLSLSLIPVGVKGGLPEQLAAAALVGLPTFQDTGKETKEPGNKSLSVKPMQNEKEAEVEIRGSNTKVINEPVRSGQQIYARGGDLIVLAPVSHGSELLADGHIHVYGPLRGRALAGVTGDQSARIFCQSLEAELVSIAGQYQISEDIDVSNWKLAVDIHLDAGRLQIQAL